MLGAYLSPSHSHYFRSKDNIISKHRIELCCLVADLFDWLMVDTWEIMQSELATFDQAMLALYKRIKTYCDFLKDTDFCV